MANADELLKALGLLPPVSGPMTSGFGASRGPDRTHLAGDIGGNEAGTPFVAPANVKVLATFKGGKNMRPNDWGVDVQEIGGQNRILKIVHAGDLSHLKPGQTFAAGTPMGVVGNAVDRPHIHFQVMDSNRNPIDWTGGQGQQARPTQTGGGTPVATYDEKTALIPSGMQQQETPGLGDFIATLLRTGAVPTRAPLSNENQPPPGPPPSEKIGGIMTGLGMLAGVGTPTQAGMGERVMALGQKEEERARATVAARNLGYQTPEELATAKEAAQVEGLQAAAALGRANVPKALAETIGTMYKTAAEKPTTITTPEGVNFTIPTAQIPNILEKFGTLQLHKQQIAGQLALQQGQLTHLGYMNEYYKANREHVLAETARLKGVPAMYPDGRPVVMPNNKPLIVTATEQIHLLGQHNPQAYAADQAMFKVLENSLNKFDDINLKIKQDPTGKVATMYKPELDATKMQLGTYAMQLWNKPNLSFPEETLATTIFAKLGKKPPARTNIVGPPTPPLAPNPPGQVSPPTLPYSYNQIPPGQRPSAITGEAPYSPSLIEAIKALAPGGKGY